MKRTEKQRLIEAICTAYPILGWFETEQFVTWWIRQERTGKRLMEDHCSGPRPWGQDYPDAVLEKFFANNAKAIERFERRVTKKFSEFLPSTQVIINGDPRGFIIAIVLPGYSNSWGGETTGVW